jgi:hypothetical protein
MAQFLWALAGLRPHQGPPRSTGQEVPAHARRTRQALYGHRAPTEVPDAPAESRAGPRDARRNLGRSHDRYFNCDAQPLEVEVRPLEP